MGHDPFCDSYGVIQEIDNIKCSVLHGESVACSDEKLCESDDNEHYVKILLNTKLINNEKVRDIRNYNVRKIEEAAKNGCSRNQ